jgi:SHS2 domain-containing protein
MAVKDSGKGGPGPCGRTEEEAPPRNDEAVTDSVEVPLPGVRGLEHTADLGLELEAPDLPELFRRGALAAMWLVLEREPTSGSPATAQARPLELVEADLAGLFRSWLRTLLYWEETEGFVTRSVAVSFAPVPLCSSSDGLAFGLSARVGGVVDPGPRVREIKGVTLHGLRVVREGKTWWGRVIFDV